MEAGQIGSGAVHPLEAMVSALESVVEVGVDAPAWTLGPRQLTDLLPRLHHQLRRLEAAEIAMLGEADRQQVGDPLGFANTIGWWSTVTRSTKPVARRQLKLAERLDDDAYKATRTAAGHGEVSLEQASVIGRSVEELPEDLVDSGLRAKAENHLIEFAHELDPQQLRIAGRKILEVEDPEIADQALARAMEAEEANAEATSSFWMRPDGHGSMLGKFKVPLLAGWMLEKHLEAIAAPQHQNATAAARGSTPKPWRLGTAFTEYLQTRPLNTIPQTGGVAATVVVTMTLDSLRGDFKAASLLDTGEAISAREARRIACAAGIIPAVLGGKSEILDLGRTRRLHSPAQRLAIALRDKTCAIEGCDRTLAQSHIHHLDPWATGGTTSLERGILICQPHHTQIHNPRYRTQPTPGGKILFVRRT